MVNFFGNPLFAGPSWLASAAWLLRLLALGALGALAGLGQVPFASPVAAMAALVAVFVLAERGGAGFSAGWALGAGYFALTLHWITEPFLVEPERTGWMAPFALVITAAGFALFWGVAFWLAQRLRLGSLGLAVLWTGAEVLRSLAFTGFPWALIGHIWTETPLAQLAALTGVHGLTLLTLGAAAVMANPRTGALRVLAPSLLVAGVVFLEPGPAPDPELGAPVVRIVQPNIPQHEKWDPALVPDHLERMLRLSAGETQANLVVWPETAPAEFLERAGPTLNTAARAAGGTPIATGIARSDEQGKTFNSLAVTDGRGNVVGVYDKAHLVPFGEYMPFRNLMDRWGLRGLAEFQGQGFSSGPGAALIDVPGIGLARPLICYEGIFAEEIGSERPRFLLLITNDAWFGDWAGPRQHLSLARLRAIEQGLPMVRSANTGISSIIDGKGRILASLPLNEAGSIDAPLPSALPPTPYARLGDWPVLVLLGLLGLWAMLGRKIMMVTRRATRT